MRVPRILRDFSILTLAGYAASLVQVARGVILAGLLGPGGLGTIALVGVVCAYAAYTDLGMAQAVGREIPLANGSGRVELALSWRWYGLTAKLVSGLLVAAALIGYVAFRGGSLDSDVRFGLLTAAVVVLLQGVTSAWNVIFQASRLFGRSAVLNLCIAVTSLAAGLAGAYVAGVKGVFVGQVCTFALGALVCFGIGSLPRLGKLQMSRFRHLAVVGLPLAALTFVEYNLWNVDQVMIAGLLSREDLGLYTVVLYVGGLLYLLPVTVAQTVGPRLLQRYGAAPTPLAVAAHVWRPAIILASLLPLQTAVAWVLVPWALGVYLPAYAGVTATLRVYVVGTYFVGVNLGASTFLLALNKHRNNIPILVFCVALNVGVDVLFVRAVGLGVVGIALGSAVTFFVYYLAHTVLVRWYFGQSVLHSLWSNLVMVAPGLLLVAWLVISWALGSLGRSVPAVEVITLPVFAIVGYVHWRCMRSAYAESAAAGGEL